MTDTLKQFISIHIPKTGGTVFLRQILRNLPSTISTNYRYSFDKDIDTSEYENADIIHGHFKYSRYEHLKRPYIVWLRDPVERFLSHYDYSIRKEHWTQAWGLGYLDIIKAASVISNLMSRYIRPPPLASYAFVGVIELYEKSIRRFGKLVDIDVEEFVSNEKAVIAEYAKNEKLEASDKERTLIKELNTMDYQLYKKAVEIVESY